MQTSIRSPPACLFCLVTLFDGVATVNKGKRGSWWPKWNRTKAAGTETRRFLKPSRSLWQEQDDGGIEPEEKFPPRQYSKVVCCFRLITDVLTVTLVCGWFKERTGVRESVLDLQPEAHVVHRYLNLTLFKQLEHVTFCNKNYDPFLNGPVVSKIGGNVALKLHKCLFVQDWFIEQKRHRHS